MHFRKVRFRAQKPRSRRFARALNEIVAGLWTRRHTYSGVTGRSRRSGIDAQPAYYLGRMGKIAVGHTNLESAVRQDFQGLRHVSGDFMQGAFARVHDEMIGQRGALGPNLHGSAAFSPSFGGSGPGAGALYETTARECRELQEVFFRLQNVESATHTIPALPQM